MSRLIAALAALLLLAPLPARADAPPPPHPALWKVADADTTIYLFGTIHALPPGLAWLEGTLARAFDRSDELVTEITDDDPATLQPLLMKHALLPPGKSLRAMLPADQRARYEAALAKLGMPAESLDRFEPWFAAVTLSTVPLMKAGYARENGAEALLDARAKAAGHPRVALETAEYQLGLFDALPLPAQARYLSEVVRLLPTFDAELARMIAAWEGGDADTLAKLMNDSQDDPALMKVLLADRNQAWAGWIAARLRKPGTVFVAVGAGHLAGRGSVQAMLASRGIASVRVQ